MKRFCIIAIVLALIGLAVWAQARTMIVASNRVFGPNDFTSDSNCVALYNFESSALTTDSKSTNTLTNNNSATESTSIFKQGAASTLLASASSQWYSREDANLADGFPYKSGSSDTTVSICGWFYLNSVPANDTDYFLFGKWDSNGNQRSFALWVTTNSDGTLTYANGGVGWDNSGTNTYEVVGVHDYDLQTSTWYHATFTYSASTKAYKLEIRNSTGTVVGTNQSGTSTNTGVVGTSAFSIGAQYSGAPTMYGFFDGYIDEVVVFNDIVTSAEAERIAKGVY